MQAKLIALLFIMASASVFGFDYNLKLHGKVIDYNAEPMNTKIKICADIKIESTQGIDSYGKCLKTSSDINGNIELNFKLTDNKNNTQVVKVLKESLLVTRIHKRRTIVYLPVTTVSTAKLGIISLNKSGLEASFKISGDDTKRGPVMSSKQVDFDYPVKVSGEASFIRYKKTHGILKLCAELSVDMIKENEVNKKSHIFRCKKIKLGEDNKFATTIYLNRMPGFLNPLIYGKPRLSQPIHVNIYIETADSTYGVVRKFPLLVRSYLASMNSAEIEADILM